MKMSKYFTLSRFSLLLLSLFIVSATFSPMAISQSAGQPGDSESETIKSIRAEYPNANLSACEIEGLNKAATFQEKAGKDKSSDGLAAAIALKKILVEANNETCQVNITFYLLDITNKFIASLSPNEKPKEISKEKIAKALKEQLSSNEILNLPLDEFFKD